MDIIEQLANPAYVTHETPPVQVALITLAGRIGDHISGRSNEKDIIRALPELQRDPAAGIFLMLEVRDNFNKNYLRYGSDFYKNAADLSRSVITKLTSMESATETSVSDKPRPTSSLEPLGEGIYIKPNGWGSKSTAVAKPGW